MTKHTLKQMILNVIDNNPRGYAETLAKVANYASGGSLKKVLVDPKKEFDKFSSLINLVRYIWGNDSIKMLVNYSEEVERNFF